VPAEKMPMSLAKFGNTSSTTIPLTMVTTIREALQTQRVKLLLCGFGVGLSWGSVYIETNNITVPDLIEI
jgi:3-oxoacyl-[acyl-carrier-protein] synthase-3